MFENSPCSTAVAITDTSFNSTLWSESLVVASWTDTDQIGGSRAPADLHRDTSPGLRSLSLSVSVYERLIRENEDLLQRVGLQTELDKCISAEHRYDLEFLKDGLARVMEQLAREHGVHCSRDMVEVRITDVDSPAAPVLGSNLSRDSAHNHIFRAHPTDFSSAEQREVATQGASEGYQARGASRAGRDLVGSSEELISV